jgi:hypothetical protein
MAPGGLIGTNQEQLSLDLFSHSRSVIVTGTG